MPKTLHSDRCCNPFKKPGEIGHKGKDLRRITQSVLDKFPRLPTNSKICSACRKKWDVDKNSNDINLNVSNEDISKIECIDTLLQMDVDTEESSFEVENTNRLSREIELEEMLEGLKQKILSLKHTDHLRLRILTIASSSWSVRKIAREFGAMRHLAGKTKDLNLI